MYSSVVVFFNNRTESATISPLDSGHLLSKSPHVSSVRLPMLQRLTTIQPIIVHPRLYFPGPFSTIP